MQKASFVIISLIIGLVVGSWIPRSELRIMKNEIETLRKQYRDCQQSKQEPSLMENVTSMLGVSKASTSLKSHPPKAKKQPTAALPLVDKKQEKSSDPYTDGLPPDDFEQTGERISADELKTGEDFQMQLEAAKDLWRTRTAHARELLQEDLMLNDEEIKGFDNVITSMNNRLQYEIANIASSVQYNDRLQTEDGLKIAHGITGVLIDTYSELDTVLPGNWRDNTSQETDIVNFIDPMVAVPLAQMYEPSNQTEQQ